MPDVTVASTTDTQESIDKVAGAASAKPAATAVVEPEEAEQAETETQTESEPAAESKKPAKSAYQKRIDQMRREIGERDREIERLKAGQTQTATTTTETKAEEKEAATTLEPTRPKPKPEDTNEKGEPKYASYEDFTEDLTDWKIEQKDAAREHQASQAKANEAANRRSTEIQSKGEEKYDDFEDVIKAAAKVTNFSDAAGVAIMRAKNAEDVMYYLATNQDDLKAFGKMDSIDQVAYVRELSVKIATGEAALGDGEEEEEAPAKPAAKESRADKAPITSARPLTNTPAPIKPVGGSAHKSSVPLDELPYQEYRKIREQQRKNRFK